MHSLPDQYRRRAIEARQRAAATRNEIKIAFEEIADNWLALAEQADWLALRIPLILPEPASRKD